MLSSSSRVASTSQEEALLRATKCGNADDILAICSSLGGMDVCSVRDTEKSRTPLHYVCLGNNLSCLEVILMYTKVIDPTDGKGKTPLALSAKHGNVQFILTLIKHGANPSLKSNLGNTPLHHACYNGHTQAVEVLLAHQVEINAVNDNGMSPLHFAAMCGHSQTCLLLLQNGAQANSSKRGGSSPLHLAARNGYAECCKVLLRFGADVNCCDQHQQIPMHLSARGGHLDCLRVLLEEGAEVNATDTEGNTAFDWADEGGHGECATFLWENGAHIKTQTGKETMRWSRPYVSGSPSMRYDHSMAAIGGKIVVFGGYGISSVVHQTKSKGEEMEEPSIHHLDDLYVLNPDTLVVSSIGTQASMEERVSIGLEMDQFRKGKSVIVGDDGLTIEYSPGEISEVGLVRATKPWRRTGGEELAYFEITILDSGLKGYIAIGLTAGENYPLNKQPGWVKESYGYHGDDGQVYHNQGSGNPFGPRFGTGDVIGCGLVFRTGEVFFTKNGAFLGAAWSDAAGKDLYPSVGLHSPGEKVLVNFGKRPFKFNLEADIIYWSTPKLSGEAPEGRSTASLLPLDDKRLLLVGGYSARALCKDIHIADLENLSWTECRVEGAPPTWRDSSVCNIGSTVIVFGGKLANRHSNRVYVLQRTGAGSSAEEGDGMQDLWTWEDITDKISGDAPLPRASHAAGVVGSKLFIFGGDGEPLDSGPAAKQRLLNDLWVLDLEKMAWYAPNVSGRPPTARQNATLTVVDKRLFIFGGWDGRRQHNDIHIFDTECMAWYKPHVTGTVPRPRNHHASALLPTQGGRKLFFFAGWNGRGYMEDLDVLDIDAEQTSELGRYCNSKSSSDVTLWVEGKPIHAHKVILASRSMHFRKIFCLTESNTSPSLSLFASESKSGKSLPSLSWRRETDVPAPNSSSDIVIPDVSYPVFLAFIQYLYTDVADASPEMIGKLLAVVRNFGEEHLDRISEYLILTWLKTPSSLNQDLGWAFNDPLFSDVAFVFPDMFYPSLGKTATATATTTTTYTTHAATTEEPQWGDESGDSTGQKLYAHKVILCARSPYFRALLLGGLRESRDKNILVDPSETPYPIFHAVVKYLYTNEVDIDETTGEDWLALLVAANRYSISSLKQMCQDVLEQSIDAENVACLFSLADTQQALSLRAACSSFILKHVDLVSQTESFCNLSEDLKGELMRRRDQSALKRKRVQSDEDAESSTLFGPAWL